MIPKDSGKGNLIRKKSKNFAGVVSLCYQFDGKDMFILLQNLSNAAPNEATATNQSSHDTDVSADLAMGACSQEEESDEAEDLRILRRRPTTLIL